MRSDLAVKWLSQGKWTRQSGEMVGLSGHTTEKSKGSYLVATDVETYVPDRRW